MDKKGQFFLIVALVIVAVLFSLGIVYNKARTQKEDTKVYELSKELDYEGGKVIDSGVYSGLSREGILNNLTLLASNYADSNTDSQFLILFGNSTNVTLVNYTTLDLGSACVETSCATGQITDISNTAVSPDGNNLTITVSGNEYDFDLRVGQNFYLIVKKTKANETYVSRS
ncbi:hypothetical protein J4217_03280 [Candidatus Pacearchaeota archaeon]|nr:hypothetical protein [Candidatus Pacearchaeota archaeon]